MTLDTKDGLDKFVNENLSKMIEELNETYGPVLFEELKNRLKFTIEEFNKEMVIVFSKLKECEKNRQKMYKMIESANIQPQETANIDEDNQNVSHWERKINEIESSN